MNRFFLVLFMIVYAAICGAQTLDDVGKIVIGLDVSESSSSETQELKEYLTHKVSHWLSQAGYSASGISSFYISPDISIDSEEVAEGGMKNVYVISGALNLKVLQINDNVIFSTISLPFRNSSTKKIAAIKNGIGKIQYQKVLPLFNEAKNKILNYYQSEKVNLFAQADLMAREGDYDGAIAYLMSIPSCLSSIYQEALVKADGVLDVQVKVYNDSILSLANSYLAQHDAKSTLDVLSAYQDAKDDQNSRYKNMVAKAEGLVTAAEIEAAREKRQRYLDAKERQYHQWVVDEKEQNHRIHMENQQMAYDRAALDANERITSQKIAADERITAKRIAADERITAKEISAKERLTSQGIAASERISSKRIYALKNIACSYYRNNPTRTVFVNYNY